MILLVLCLICAMWYSYFANTNTKRPWKEKFELLSRGYIRFYEKPNQFREQDVEIKRFQVMEKRGRVLDLEMLAAL